MGKRGPKPDPRKLIRLVRKNGGGPRRRGPSARPRCPSWLHPRAKQFWSRVVPELRDTGVLEAIDETALAALCQTYARWREAEEFLDQHGSVYPIRDDDGRVRCMQQFPQVSIARHALARLQSLSAEFGLLPGARLRLGVQWVDAEEERERQALRERMARGRPQY